MAKHTITGAMILGGDPRARRKFLTLYNATPLRELGELLGVSRTTLHRWERAARSGK